MMKLTAGQFDLSICQLGKGCRTALLTGAAILCLQTAGPLLLDSAGSKTGPVWMSALLGQANAAEDSGQQEQRKTKRTPTISQKVYEKLQEAQELVEAKKIKDASRILDELLAREGKQELEPYAKANVWNFYAYIYFTTDQYDKAIHAYEQVLAQPDLPEAMAISTKYSLAQLYFLKEDWPKAIATLLEWFNLVEGPSPDAYVLLGQAYIQVNNYDKALFNIEKAVAMAKEKGQSPRENWYQLLRFLYNEKNNVPKQQEVLETLVRNWPKKEYWIGLAGIYGEQERELDQMHTLETAYVQGMLNRNGELVLLSQLFAANGMPYKAAKVMEKGFKDNQITADSRNYERLGEYWRRAQEIDKALPDLEKASELSDDGEPYVRLAQLYFGLDKFKQAIKAAKAGLAKGKLRRPEQARMLLAQSQFYAQAYDDADKTFNSLIALTDKKYARIRKDAKKWQSYMRREQERQRQIEEYLN